MLLQKRVIILFLFLAVQVMSSIPNQNLVIGVFTQQYIYGDHSPIYNSATLTYIAPTFSNIAAMTGAKAVPIFSYSTKQQILDQLSKVNGVIFTGGEEHIFINTTWTKNAQVVVQYAKKQNDEGIVFPILGICQGLQVMLYLSSDLRWNFLDTIENQSGVFNTMQLQTNQYYLLDGLSDSTLDIIKDGNKTPEGGPLFFVHSNGTLLSTFQNDSDMKSFWNLIGTTSKLNQTFVTYLQAKQYPFYITQFHPQRLVYSSLMSDDVFFARGEIVMTIALNFAMKCKQNKHQYPKDQLQLDLIQNYPQSQSIRFPNYNVYLFNQFGSSGNLRQGTLTQQGLDSRTINMIVGVIFAGLIGAFIYKYIRQKQQLKRRTDYENNVNLQQTPNPNFGQYNYQNNNYQNNQFQQLGALSTTNRR